jgi:hypothetical protein
MMKKALLALLLSLAFVSQGYAQKGSTIGGGSAASGITYLIDSYGAIGDSAQGSGASITSGANIVSGGSTNCANTDAGKGFLMPGAGAGGAALETTVSSCSGSSYALAANATFSVSSSTFWVGYSGVQVQTDGTGCVPADVITLTGGTAVSQGQLTVQTCQVHGATINAAGSGGTTGGCVLTDAGTFTGEPFRIYATVASGSISALGAFIHKGDYSVNPSTLSAEPVTGCGLTGSPTLTITMGISQQVSPGSGIFVSAPGSYTTQPASPVAAGSSTGAETGETFNIYFPAGGPYTYGHNNATAVQAALTAADTNGGGTVQFTCGKKYLVAGAALTVGDQTNLPAVTMQGCRQIGQGGAVGNMSGAAASGLWFDPTGGNKINVFGGSAVKNLATFNPLMNYAGASDTFRANADRINSFSGIAYHFGNSGGGRGGGVLIDTNLVVGYASAIETKNNGNWRITHNVFDDINFLNIASIPDYSWIQQNYCHVLVSNTATAPASNSITAIATNSGLTKITTTNPHGFSVNDQVVIGTTGSYPNQTVTGYPTADVTGYVASVQDANDFTLNVAFNAGQTYVSGGTVNWYYVRQGECGYYNGQAAGNDGLEITSLDVNGWLTGWHSFGLQGQHFTLFSKNGLFQDPNSKGLWLDGTVENSDVAFSEVVGDAYPLYDTTYGNTAPYQISFTAGQYLGNGMGYQIDHLGSQALNFSQYKSNRGSNQAMNIGDGAGTVSFSGASDLTNIPFYAQSYTDWSKLIISPDTIVGGSLGTYIGGAVLPPATMNTTVSGTNSTSNPLGACDVGEAPVICVGMRRELSTYTGPIVNVTNVASSATIDLRQDAFGNIDQGQCASFQGNSTLTIAKAYDQSGNANNINYSPQPAFSCSVAKLNGRPGPLFVNGTSTEGLISSSASWQGLFSGANPGTILFSVLPTGVFVNSDRIFEINSGGGVNSVSSSGINGGSTLNFGAGYSTTTGVWVTSGSLSTTALSVLDYTYQWTVTTNNPVIDFNGTSQTFGSTTTPVGTAGVDTGQTLAIGGIGSATTVFPGYIPTVVAWKNGPGAAQLEQARKAEGAYYGTAIN